MSCCEFGDCYGGGMSRRQMLRLGVGVAGAASILGRPSQADSAQAGVIPPAARVRPPAAWFEQLSPAREPIVYRGEHLQELIFPLGGIGTGTVWLHGTGRLVNWQIFNNIQKDTLVDDSFFAIRMEAPGRPPAVRVLQRDPVGSVPGFEDISFCGPYPMATIRFRDAALPVEVELEAFNPLVPHDEDVSSLPCAIFAVRAINTSVQPVRVALLASLQNAVYHTGRGASDGFRHLTYGRNVNRARCGARGIKVMLDAEPGCLARLEPAVELCTDHQDLPVIDPSPVAGLRRIGVAVPHEPASKRIYWLRTGDVNLLGGAALAEIAGAVRDDGAVLILEGSGNPLARPVQSTLPPDVTRQETVFEDFDGDDYGQWERYGRSFDKPWPQRGAFPGQHRVTGFLGSGLANSRYPSDYKRGVLISPKFTIGHEHIGLLVGGGNHPEMCCVVLLVDGQVKRSATGENTTHLRRVEWDVREFLGHEATLEIRDRHQGEWGHILADDIRFANVPVSGITHAEAAAWNNMLETVRAHADGMPTPYGRGRVIRIDSMLSEPVDEADAMQRRHAMLARLAELAELAYTPAVGLPPEAPSAGSMCLATPEREATVQHAWTDRDALLASFQRDGRLVESLEEGQQMESAPTATGRTVNAALSISHTVEPGAAAKADFVMGWFFPNQYYTHNDWRPIANPTVRVGTRYATRFTDAAEVADHVLEHLEQLRERTDAFRRAMFDTTLPQYLVDAVAANISVVRSPTCFRAEDGTFYGYEGSREEGGGCCPMNCNHVWGYAQALAWMWPALERNMRETELKYHQQEDGAVHHRVEVPRDDPEKTHPPVADGQCMAVLKVYREHLLSTDRGFLASYWPNARGAMDFAIDRWDPDRTGLPTEPQHNTHDWVVYGWNTFVGSTYLAALRAAEEMATLMDEPETASRYRALRERGARLAAEQLYNGEYYIHKSDRLDFGYGTGCWSEQVMGQWWARVLGLGDILPPPQVRHALKAIFKHNWLWTHEGFVGTQRAHEFADGNDKGLLTGTWPRGGRPETPMLHRDEVWTGIEYLVAAHKLYECQVEEALVILKGLRERYDGRKKSPYNEIECGDYYVRAMSSWSVLLAAQGYRYDGPAGVLALDPRLSPEDHRSLLVTAAGYGTFEQRRTEGVQTNRLNPREGHFVLRTLQLTLPAGVPPVTVQATLNGERLNLRVQRDGDALVLGFEPSVTVEAGQFLAVETSWLA